MNVTKEKQALRQQIKERIDALSIENRLRESTEVCVRLPLLLQDATGVAGYIALPDEVDITPLLQSLLKEGVPVFLPRYENGTVTFHAMTSLDVLETGSLGILEPPPTATQPAPEAISHVLVPGRAFDLDGRRLGRGKGGYDRWIADQRKDHPETLCIGLAFQEQIVPAVPEDTHDQRMEAVVTPQGLLVEDPFTRDE